MNKLKSPATVIYDALYKGPSVTTAKNKSQSTPSTRELIARQRVAKMKKTIERFDEIGNKKSRKQTLRALEIAKNLKKLKGAENAEN
jgi:hypothetical protein